MTPKIELLIAGPVVKDHSTAVSAKAETEDDKNVAVQDSFKTVLSRLLDFETGDTKAMLTDDEGAMPLDRKGDAGLVDKDDTFVVHPEPVNTTDPELHNFPGRARVQTSFDPKRTQLVEVPLVSPVVSSIRAPHAGAEPAGEHPSKGVSIEHQHPITLGEHKQKYPKVFEPVVDDKGAVHSENQKVQKISAPATDRDQKELELQFHNNPNRLAAPASERSSDGAMSGVRNLVVPVSQTTIEPSVVYSEPRDSVVFQASPKVNARNAEVFPVRPTEVVAGNVETGLPVGRLTSASDFSDHNHLNAWTAPVLLADNHRAITEPTSHINLPPSEPEQADERRNRTAHNVETVKTERQIQTLPKSDVANQTVVTEKLPQARLGNPVSPGLTDRSQAGAHVANAVNMVVEKSHAVSTNITIATPPEPVIDARQAVPLREDIEQVYNQKDGDKAAQLNTPTRPSENQRDSPVIGAGQSTFPPKARNAPGDYANLTPANSSLPAFVPREAFSEPNTGAEKKTALLPGGRKQRVDPMNFSVQGSTPSHQTPPPDMEVRIRKGVAGTTSRVEERRHSTSGVIGVDESVKNIDQAAYTKSTSARLVKPELQSGNLIAPEGLEAPTITDTRLRADGIMTTRPSADAVQHRPEIAQQIAVQISDAVQKNGERPIELLLNPSELGRVRIALSMIDGLVTVNVIAERPETMDMVRRHVDLLAQEFRNSGFGGTEFSFGENQNQARPQGEGKMTNPLTTTDKINDEPDQSHSSVLPDRVDIRL